MAQVRKTHYDFERYVQPDRWASYYYQLKEILALSPASVLEVGPGDATVRDQVVRRGIAYTSVDTAEDLAPDVVADVRALPFSDASFDVVCAFEVLEHLPLDTFDEALRELARVSKGPVLVSLPHFGPPLQLHLKLPFLPHIRLAWKVPWPMSHQWNGQHYWEIGKRESSVRRIRERLKRVFRVERDYVPFEHQYHHFFILKKL